MEPGENALTWEDTYAIAQALRKSHPDQNLENVSLMTIFEWTLSLHEFVDDPELANDDILAAIYQEWYEEVIQL